jgi:hypothetical protein
MQRDKRNSSVPAAILAELETVKKRSTEARHDAESALRAGKKALAKADRAVRQTTQIVRPRRSAKS